MISFLKVFSILIGGLFVTSQASARTLICTGTFLDGTQLEANVNMESNAIALRLDGKEVMRFEGSVVRHQMEQVDGSYPDHFRSETWADILAGSESLKIFVLYPNYEFGQVQYRNEGKFRGISTDCK